MPFEFFKDNFIIDGSLRYPFVFDFKGINAISFIDVVLSGVSPLVLEKAIQLNYLKLFGGTEQNGTPTPDTPVDIISNNGVVKARHQSGLPLRYQQVEWISSNAKIIITGFKTKDTQTFKAKFIKTSVNAQYVYYSDSNSSGATNTTAYISASDTSGGYWRFDGDTISITVLANVMYETTQNKNGIWINGSRFGKYSNIDSFTSTTDLGALSAASAAPLRLYYLQVEENGIKVLDLVPVKDLVDNTYGLYDLIGGVFYTNADATITAGSTVSDPVEIYTDGTVETIALDGGTATAEMLLKVGDYKDAQSILEGVITRNVGIKVLDGTENWAASGNLFYADMATDALEDTHSCYCTHFKGIATNASANYANEIKVGTNATQTVNWVRVQIYPVVGTYSDVNAFKQFLVSQYIAGTPVIVVYPLATPTTESVAGQTLTASGNCTSEITQASINNLELEVGYRKQA